MEKFETYRIEGIYYSEEELKELGFSILNCQDVSDLMQSKGLEHKVKLFKVQEKNSSLCSCQELLDIMSEPEINTGFFDRMYFIDKSINIVLQVDVFYGIKHNDHIYITTAKSERNDKYHNIEYQINKSIDECSPSYSTDTYKTQQEIKQKIKRLKAISKDD